MSKAQFRSGGKYRGKHTTLIPLAARLCDQLESAEAVTGLGVGVIKRTPRSSDRKHVKVTIRDTLTLLKISESSGHQEVRVFGSDREVVVSLVKTAAEKLRMTISFGETLS